MPKDTEAKPAGRLNQQISRRAAIGKTGSAAVGVVVGAVIGGLGGYFGGVSQAGPAQTVTQTVTRTQTAVQTVTQTQTPTLTGKPPAEDPLFFNIWPYRPDLVQISVDHFNKEHNENLQLGVISANYFGELEKKYIADGDLDMNYTVMDHAHRSYAAGWIWALDDIRKSDLVTWDIQDAKRDMLDVHLKAYTAKDGKLIGLPYFMTARGAILTNEKLLEKAGLAGQPPANYEELYENIETIKKKGITNTPYLPHWYVPPTGVGIPWALIGEVVAQGGEKEMFSSTGEPNWDTNTLMGDVLRKWKELFDAELVPKSVITLSSEPDWMGAFASGQYAYSGQAAYDLTTFNDPSFSKFAGFCSIVPATKHGWGVLEVDDYVIAKRKRTTEYRNERQKAMIMWFGYKNNGGQYETAMRLATEAGIAAMSGYNAVNTSSEVIKAWTPKLMNPEKDVEAIASVTRAGVVLEVFKEPWYTPWQLRCQEEIPLYLLGQKSLDDVLSTLRNVALDLKKKHE